MPCYDSRNDPDYVRGEERTRAFRDFTHNSPVAELLCRSITRLIQWDEADGTDTVHNLLANDPALSAWWFEHVQRDRKVKHGKGKRR